MDRLRIIENLARKYDIALIYLFGSQAATGLDILKGAKHSLTDPLTDLDVGVVFKAGLPGVRAKIEIYCELYDKLQDLFAPYPVDLVFLQETHSVFQGNAICEECIYYISEAFKNNYEERVLCHAADYRPFLERYLDEILEGAAENGSG